MSTILLIKILVVKLFKRSKLNGIYFFDNCSILIRYIYGIYTSELAVYSNSLTVNYCKRYSMTPQISYLMQALTCCVIPSLSFFISSQSCPFELNFGEENNYKFKRLFFCHLI